MTDPLLCARGSYQAALLTGRARWSGADLRGAARTWSARYAASRRALVARLRAAGHVVSEDKILNAARRWVSVLRVDGEIVSEIP